jgi:hypothetical protein
MFPNQASSISANDSSEMKSLASGLSLGRSFLSTLPRMPGCPASVWLASRWVKYSRFWSGKVP